MSDSYERKQLLYRFEHGIASHKHSSGNPEERLMYCIIEFYLCVHIPFHDIDQSWGQALSECLDRFKTMTGRLPQPEVIKICKEKYETLFQTAITNSHTSQKPSSPLWQGLLPKLGFSSS